MDKDKALNIEQQLEIQFPTEVARIRQTLGVQRTIANLLEDCEDTGIEAIPVFDSLGRRRLEMYLRLVKANAGIIEL